ncbi:hypothetical protein D5W64_12350 [Salmonella enterica subsp. enterica serovar Saintpaul]|nr:hypothetical protein [Salmonella enterica subsp. enterica serovar Saintpaul]
MFFDKLLNKIPFFRKRRVKKMKEQLTAIRKDFKEGHYNDVYISSLHNILNSPLVSFSDDLVRTSLGSVEVYSKSSMGAFKLVNDPIISRPTLERSNLIGLELKKKFVTEWYSNESSLTDFVNIMKLYLLMHTKMFANVDVKTHNEMSVIAAAVEPDFLDSLLYRLLLSDLANITTFYIESKYD